MQLTRQAKRASDLVALPKARVAREESFHGYSPVLESLPLTYGKLAKSLF